MEPLEWIFAIVCITPIAIVLTPLANKVFPHIKDAKWFKKITQKTKEAAMYRINHFQYSAIWKWINPRITRVARSKFEKGEYTSAVLSSCLEIEEIVRYLYKQRSGKDKRGRELYQSTFSRKNPTIKLANTEHETGQNIQEGFMHLFEGMYQAYRDPVAHHNLTITAKEALKFFFLASNLMDKIDQAEPKASEIVIKPEDYLMPNYPN